jgi:colicin import membrane protein
VAEEAKAKAEAEHLRLEQAREEEASELADKLKRLREQRASEMALGAPPSATDEPPAADGTDAHRPPDSEIRATEIQGTGTQPTVAMAPGTANTGTTVTVLLALEPGTYGIRRGSRAADPVLCLGKSCYVSKGAGVAARKSERGSVLGPFNTLGGRAGACRGSLTCVFRGVDLAASPLMQPVDMHILKHDKREPLAVGADTTCRVADGRLACARIVEGKGWRALIVPEPVAEAAGADALKAAASGLAGPVRLSGGQDGGR